MTILLVVLTVGAVFRLSWLVAADALTEGFRDAVEARFGAEHKLTYFVHCLWCASMWIAPAVVVATFFASSFFVWLWLALSASLVTGAVGSPLYKWLGKEPLLSDEELAAELHEAQRSQEASLEVSVPWLSTDSRYREAMMDAVKDMRKRKIIE